MFKINGYANYKIGFVNDEDLVPIVIRTYDNLIIPHFQHLESNEYHIRILDDELNLKLLPLSELLYLTKAPVLKPTRKLITIFKEPNNYRSVIFLTYRDTDILKYNYAIKFNSVMIKLSKTSKSSLNSSLTFNSEVEACLKLQASRNAFRGKSADPNITIDRYKISYEVTDLETNEIFIFKNKHALVKKFNKKIEDYFTFFKNEGNDILKLKIIYN